MVLPALLIFGLLLIPIGMWLERRRRARMLPGQIPRFPRIDLNNRAQRSAFAFFITFTALFITLSAVGSYRAYQFTDSVQFCGQLCHTVMDPEYTAYLQSPHARVACVDCHVGAGASWYVRSKLSGSYQVYSAIFHKYPRPIPTPVANLRPAQQTCEQCHWPSRFFGAQLKVFTHFANDEKNTPRQIRMLINTGGGDPATGLPSGIHWHMNIANEITYITTDAQHQVIPWVRVRNRQTNQVTIYAAKDSPLKAEEIERGPKHVMDCIDCHNRPTHVFTPPEVSVDNAMLAKKLDPNLPFIKLQATTALAGNYTSNDEAMAAIDKDLHNFYATKYPQQARAAVDNAVQQVQAIYSKSIFPYMKVDWRTHPSNIGHFYFPGCFRCHDGNHVSAEGKVVTKDCNACHTVLQQVESGVPAMGQMAGTGFKHPVDIGDLAGVTCNDCHTGGVSP
jgi:nitrate/TMAO reductase-like tetraheme cytochrome c subunit